MIITNEMLQGKYVTDWTRKAMEEAGYVGKEIKDMIADYMLPDLACNLMFELELPDEDMALLEECAEIDDMSTGIYKSCVIRNSRNVAGSRDVVNSTIVMNSTHVTSSSSIYDSTNVSVSEVVVYNSGNVDNSVLVSNSYKVKNSRVIVDSKNVFGSMFIYGADSASHSLLCSSILSNREPQNFFYCILCNQSHDYAILNHEIPKEQFGDISVRVKNILKDYLKAHQEKVNELFLLLNRPILSWDIYKVLDNPNMWRKIISFFPFMPTKEDYMLLYNITMQPFFLDF